MDTLPYQLNDSKSFLLLFYLFLIFSCQRTITTQSLRRYDN